MQDQIFEMLLKQDDITWQTIIADLIRTEKMDPWDVDVSLLAQKYIELLKQLKEFDFKVSGKVVLCAALLLKIKSNRLVGEDMAYFDSLFVAPEDTDIDLLGDDVDPYLRERALFSENDNLTLIPRTPQPRKRKVSIYDLMDALQKALEVKKRRVLRGVPENVEVNIPKKKFDITEGIREVFGRIKLWFLRNPQKIKFSQLTPSDSKEDKVYTFIPLLHLTNERKIDLEQKEHFGEIEIDLLRNAPTPTNQNPQPDNPSIKPETVTSAPSS